MLKRCKIPYVCKGLRTTPVIGEFNKSFFPSLPPALPSPPLLLSFLLLLLASFSHSFTYSFLMSFLPRIFLPSGTQWCTSYLSKHFTRRVFRNRLGLGWCLRRSTWRQENILDGCWRSFQTWSPVGSPLPFKSQCNAGKEGMIKTDRFGHLSRSWHYSTLVTLDQSFPFLALSYPIRWGGWIIWGPLQLYNATRGYRCFGCWRGGVYSVPRIDRPRMQNGGRHYASSCSKVPGHTKGWWDGLVGAIGHRP